VAMHEWKPDPDGPRATGRLVDATEGFASAVHDDIVDALKDWSGIVDPTLWQLVMQAVNEIELMRNAGDALAKSYRGLCIAHGYLMYEQIDSTLRAWQEARRG
jgi:hypothetical protein